MSKKNIQKVFQSSSIYSDIENLCLKIDPRHDPELVNNETANITKASQLLSQQVLAFHKEMETYSLISLILLWAKSMSTVSVYGEKNIRIMSEMLERGMINIVKNQEVILFRDYPEHEYVINAVRCLPEWTIEKKEEAVLMYIDFSEWLFKVSYGYISPADDLDRAIVARRKVPFETYIKLISQLELRERALVKLFYFGGLLTIEQVFSLRIADIDYQNNLINFSEQKVNYPSHVFLDLKNIVEKKRAGFVFVNRSGEKVNHAVPYRILKQAAFKLGLDPTFTFRDLSLNH